MWKCQEDLKFFYLGIAGEEWNASKDVYFTGALQLRALARGNASVTMPGSTEEIGAYIMRRQIFARVAGVAAIPPVQLTGGWVFPPLSTYSPGVLCYRCPNLRPRLQNSRPPVRPNTLCYKILGPAPHDIPQPQNPM